MLRTRRYRLYIEGCMRECPLFGVILVAKEFTTLVYPNLSTQFLPAEGLLWGRLKESHSPNIC